VIILSLTAIRQNDIITPSRKGGAIMAERDYHKEYERDKSKKKNVGVQITPDLFDAFTAKTELNGTTKNAVLKACAEAYTYGNLIIDENGKPKILK
jgi:hypothetical protein